MPDVMKPVDGQPWPAGVFLRDSPTWAPSGIIGAPASAYGSGDGALSFSVTGGVVTVLLSLFRGRSRGAFYERTGSSWSSGASATADSLATPAYALNSGSNPRIDRMVLRRAAGSQQVYPFIIQGTPAATPSKPALTQVENGTWDTPLFSWQLAGGNSTTVSNITDERSWTDPGGLAILPSLTAYRSANQGIGTGAAGGVVVLDTVEAGAVPGFRLDTATGLITVEDRGQGIVPVDISAAYTLIQAGTAGASSNPVRAYIAAQINGAEVRRGQDQHARGYLNGDLQGRVLTTTRHLVSPGDVLGLRYYHDSGQASTLLPGAAVTWMSVRRAA